METKELKTVVVEDTDKRQRYLLFRWNGTLYLRASTTTAHFFVRRNFIREIASATGAVDPKKFEVLGGGIFVRESEYRTVGVEGSSRSYGSPEWDELSRVLKPAFPGFTIALRP